MVITKEDFEAALPVGTSSHDEVFEAVLPAIEDCMAQTDTDIMGEAGLQAMEGNTLMTRFYQRYVCIAGFLSVLRELDLVLTPTGFGIVSNDNVSPASKQRVDDLEVSLRVKLFKTRAMLLNLLRGEDWGATPQAANVLPYLYDEYHFMSTSGRIGFRTNLLDEWKQYQDIIIDADTTLRKHISDEQIDELLDAFRKSDTERLGLYMKIIDRIRHYIDALAIGKVMAPVYLRRIIVFVESKPEVFTLYPNSSAYKLNHHETYQNTKESSAFVFNG